MPIYMDIHHVPGIEAIDAAEAHRKDILIQAEYDCTCMTYWVDVARGVAFCLIKAPDKQIVEEIHRNSHGLIPNKIIEVNQELVESFLGRINDPDDAPIAENGLKVFAESAMRFLLVTDMADTVLLRHRLGPELSGELLDRHNQVLAKALRQYQGRPVECGGQGTVASFSTATNAVSCALMIQAGLSETDKQTAGWRIVVGVGEPVEKGELLFGDSLLLARRLCTLTCGNRVVLSGRVNDLMDPAFWGQVQQHLFTLSPGDEEVLTSLYDALDTHWQEIDFDIATFCMAMAMSKSRLYRRTTELFGLSPNGLIREFRLDKAREMLKGRSFNVSQTTFDAGFSSPSYFTKCFKKKFGLLPVSYLDALG